ncbi:MAG: DUF4350 domain-containing protein [Candidatus Eremiobacteraeota bacterium]|nr:DUF4350 domain-containing protein [Candidatus Eremiobacteraeota bacterium]
MRRNRAADIAFVIGGIVTLALLAIAGEGQPGQAPSVYSTYDFGRNGYAALSELLRRENRTAGQFERPASLLDGVRTLVVSGQAPLDQPVGLTPGDVDALAAWVRAGGHLVLLGRVAMPSSKLELPKLAAVTAPVHLAVAVEPALQRAHIRRVAGTFDAVFSRSAKKRARELLAANGKPVALEYAFGRGRITAIGDASIFANVHLARADNARFAYAMLDSSPVAFDERVHGYVQGRSFWSALPASVHTAIWLTCAIVLLGLIGANIRFAPALQPEQSDERDTSAYIDSMARLFQRGGAASRALHDCIEGALRPLRVRAGLGPNAGIDQILARIDRPLWRDIVLELDRLQQHGRLNDSILIRAGRLSAQLRKDVE